MLLVILGVIFSAFLIVVVVAPRCEACLKNAEKFQMIETQLEKLWKHRDSIASHVSSGKERRGLLASFSFLVGVLLIALLWCRFW